MAKFEGKNVAMVKVKPSGDVGDARINPSLKIGDEAVIVATVKVKAVKHSTNSAGVVSREQTCEVVDGFVVLDSLDAADLIHRLHAERQSALDELLGTPGMIGPDGDVNPDAAPPE